MKIVFDLDNTLADELGQGLRPSAVPVLERLQREGFSLALWTSSTRSRAIGVLETLEISEFFPERVFREDYDPQNAGEFKDIRRIAGDILVDDDPKQICFVERIGRRGILVPPYRPGGSVRRDEGERLYREIAKGKWLRGLSRVLPSRR